MQLCKCCPWYLQFCPGSFGVYFTNEVTVTFHYAVCWPIDMEMLFLFLGVGHSCHHGICALPQTERHSSAETQLYYSDVMALRSSASRQYKLWLLPNNFLSLLLSVTCSYKNPVSLVSFWSSKKAPVHLIIKLENRECFGKGRGKQSMWLTFIGLVLA